MFLCACVCVCLVYVVYFEGTLKVKIDNSYWSGRQLLCAGPAFKIHFCVCVCVYARVCVHIVPESKRHANKFQKREPTQRQWQREREAEAGRVREHTQFSTAGLMNGQRCSYGRRAAAVASPKAMDRESGEQREREREEVSSQVCVSSTRERKSIGI